ncbi:hypothetical protein SAMN04487950_1993 [Halogranum rubrum]|uniref:Uncharacterized protein n=1 Tax=Halogranum rubrum TaxID=553466 RepID=A0A1I4ECN4_9EURY|nr:hypothetical protein SAMN04487950_1993 [Halogranum rubrum]
MVSPYERASNSTKRWSRRSIVQTAGAVLLTVLTTGCLFRTGQNHGVTDVVIKNSTDSQKEVTVVFVDCSISNDKQQTVEVSPGATQKLNNVVVMNSGVCELSLEIQGREKATHNWKVARSTLVADIKKNKVRFYTQ